MSSSAADDSRLGCVTDGNGNLVSASLASVSPKSNTGDYAPDGSMYFTLTDGNGNVTAAVSATGASRSLDGAGNTLLTFIANGTLTTSTALTAKALVVGGGGGGSSGGGAGGQVATSNSLSIPSGTTTITVGVGGFGQRSGSVNGSAGGSSSIGSLLTAGGGGGGSSPNQSTVTNGGGCGAGNSVLCTASAGSVAFAGGSVTAVLTPYAAGGGSGAGGVGGNTAGGSTGGAGGIGVTSSITGTAVSYGGGGGGGIGGNGTGGLGHGGGGNGGGNVDVGLSGLQNTGGGGGGTGFNGGTITKGGTGADGVVILSFPFSAAPAVTPYTGVVATRCYPPAKILASTTGWNSRIAHYARDNITSLQLVDVNWYAPLRTGEANQGGTRTITRAIEYPVKTSLVNPTLTQVTWSSATSVVIPDGGQVISDPVAIVIPKGALFYERLYQVNQVGMLSTAASGFGHQRNLIVGDAVNNTNVDGTMLNTVADSAVSLDIPCAAAIIATTSQPTIGIVGSSRTGGNGDLPDLNGNTGYTRLYGTHFGYIDAATSGDTMNAVAGTGGAKRRALCQAYCSHFWIDPGLNDVLLLFSVGATIANVQSLVAGWPGGTSKVILNNEAAYTTSTDSWATTTNQHTDNTVEPFRVSLNAGCAAITGLNQYVDCNAAEGNGTNSQFWNNPVAGTIVMTADGVHENNGALLLLVASGVFNPNLVTLP